MYMPNPSVCKRSKDEGERERDAMVPTEDDVAAERKDEGRPEGEENVRWTLFAVPRGAGQPISPRYTSPSSIARLSTHDSFFHFLFIIHRSLGLGVGHTRNSTSQTLSDSASETQSTKKRRRRQPSCHRRFSSLRRLLFSFFPPLFTHLIDTSRLAFPDFLAFQLPNLSHSTWALFPFSREAIRHMKL